MNSPDVVLSQLAFEAGASRLYWEHQDELRAFASAVAWHCAGEMIRLAITHQIEGGDGGLLQFAEEIAPRVAGLFDQA